MAFDAGRGVFPFEPLIATPAMDAAEPYTFGLDSGPAGIGSHITGTKGWISRMQSPFTEGLTQIVDKFIPTSMIMDGPLSIDMRG